MPMISWRKKIINFWHFWENKLCPIDYSCLSRSFLLSSWHWMLNIGFDLVMDLDLDLDLDLGVDLELDNIFEPFPIKCKKAKNNVFMIMAALNNYLLFTTESPVVTKRIVCQSFSMKSYKTIYKTIRRYLNDEILERWK